MFKALTMMKRRDGMSMADFIDFDENHHSNMVKHFPHSVRYLRKYLAPRKSAFGTVQDPSFDVVMELWFESAADFEADMSKLTDPDLVREFIEDEERLFDRPHTRSFTDEEYKTDSNKLTGRRQSGMAIPE